MHRHKPTIVKPNKKFKSRHSTKGQLKAKTKGRVQHDELSGHRLSSSYTSSKADRRNTAKMIQKRKRAEVIRGQRLYSGLNGVPKVVVCDLSVPLGVTCP